MTEEEKIVRRAQGCTIYEHQGKTICLNLEDFDKERFCKDWGFKNVAVFTEELGNKVLYDSTQYKVITRNNCNFLCYKGYSEKPIQPVGCTTYYKMFANRIDLTNLDLSNWDTRRVVNMIQMFVGCEKLESINLAGWDVTAVESFTRMFKDCYELMNLNIDGWKMRASYNNFHMFDWCLKLYKKYEVSKYEEDASDRVYNHIFNGGERK